jgi:hypothetical protein
MCKDNIKTDVNDIQREDMDWDQWQALVNTVINVWVLASQALCIMVLVKHTVTNMVSSLCHCYDLAAM